MKGARSAVSPTSTGPAGRVGWRIVAVLVLAAVVCWPAATALLTIHLTAQQAGYYRAALDDARLHERIYDEVLTDPELADVTGELLAGLPVKPEVVVDNLQIVVPPSTLRGFTDGLAAEVAGYLGGSRPDFVLSVDLAPVLENIGRLATVYLAGGTADAPRYRTEDISAALAGVLEAVERMSRGEPPASVPQVDLTDEQVEQVAALLIDRVPEPERQSARDQVIVALRGGDIASALAVVGPLIFSGDVSAVNDLRQRLDDGTVLDLGRPLENTPPSAGISAVRAIHRLGAAGLLAIAALLLAVLAAAVAAVAARAWRARSDGGGMSGGMSGGASGSWVYAAVRPVSAALAAGSLAAIGLGLVLPTLVGEPLAGLTGPGSPLPPAGRELAGDVEQALVDRIQIAWLRLAGLPVLLALGLLAGTAVTHRLMRAWSQAGEQAGAGAEAGARSRATYRRRRWAALAGICSMFVASSWILFPGEAGTGSVFCNGAADLCDRRYPEVVHPAAHNAMASVEAGFLGAVQDPDLPGQLDAGIRALLIDVHHWTTPAEVETFLAGLRPSAREALAPFARGASSQRPGLWLCHGVCQLGATPLSDGLADIADWLAANPSEVVTLIIQDHAPAEDIMAAFETAGLGPYLATPPDEEEQWPTLAEMIDSGRRLVVFAENGDEPGTWYRNFFRMGGADTPFTISAPDGFSCRLGRGPSRPTLLLVNHWLTDHAASRADAALVNTAQSLVEHVQLCAHRGLTPTFLAVNFAGLGDVVATAAELNRRGPVRLD